ncbi:hypothetical protein K443DRAFT_10467 [Laccaria amethystina LaAM-08-1]|uniref:Uncharacterized protein n=1 Tax=Laccaria amethystina LaAM-08-1 TaxID=1095629 RepID=A0A0C9XKD0_9AGAR|nr:hypothetical protein K443DRAFT_10467 [Laccaria amethystina LaAM-08-1]
MAVVEENVDVDQTVVDLRLSSSPPATSQRPSVSRPTLHPPTRKADLYPTLPFFAKNQVEEATTYFGSNPPITGIPSVDHSTWTSHDCASCHTNTLTKSTKRARSFESPFGALFEIRPSQPPPQSPTKAEFHFQVSTLSEPPFQDSRLPRERIAIGSWGQMITRPSEHFPTRPDDTPTDSKYINDTSSELTFGGTGINVFEDGHCGRQSRLVIITDFPHYEFLSILEIIFQTSSQGKNGAYLLSSAQFLALLSTYRILYARDPAIPNFLWFSKVHFVLSVIQEIDPTLRSAEQATTPSITTSQPPKRSSIFH